MKKNNKINKAIEIKKNYYLFILYLLFQIKHHVTLNKRIVHFRFLKQRLKKKRDFRSFKKNRSSN